MISIVLQSSQHRVQADVDLVLYNCCVLHCADKADSGSIDVAVLAQRSAVHHPAH